ncbi:hypothetical protein [Pedobacter cryoconitis]|uniref:Bacteriocin class II with double-glycine leader peptide n=1 Tax=Pedobacter cryoconitis TaxID=188932 RepID=A0A7X0MH33_9SPHI|nr:hypothetical protein [Pedobacter cryoconitis]MBB6498977.1 hypothetical protein [Pedobacter cryoconitis]
MKKLSLDKIENVNGGGWARLFGCGLAGLAAGAAVGMNPIIGGMATASCFLLNK